MAISTIQRVAASGSTSTFSVPFPYLDKAHVQVYRAGVLLVVTTDYTWPTDSTIQLVAGNPAAGTIIERRRVTPVAPLTTFNPGNLDTTDLNVSVLQPLYLAQEGCDIGLDIVVRGWFTANYGDGGTITVGDDGELLMWDAGGNVVPGPSATDIQGYAAAALAAQLAAEAAQADALAKAQAASASAVAANASAVAAAASASAINLPSPVASTMLVRNAGNTAYDAKTAAQVEALLTNLQSGVGAVARFVQNKFADCLSVKDFGAVGDGVTNDTAALQAAATASGVLKCGVFVPAGQYLISTEITLPQGAIRWYGEGPSISVIIQQTAAANGLKFVATGSNRVTGNFALVKSVQLADLSILRPSGTNGGFGVHAEWIKDDTNNQTYLLLDNVQIFTSGNLNGAWAKGLYLKNANGTRLNNCVIKGNESEAATATANPFTMTQAIHYDQDGTTVNGGINHFITNLSTGASGDAILVGGLYEGFYITNAELVHHHTAIRNLGSVSLNSVFNLVNVHMDTRYRALDFTNVFKLHASNCDLLVSGAFSNTVAKLIGCGSFSFTGSCTFSGGGIAGGLDTDNNCRRGIVTGCSFQSCPNGVVLRCAEDGSLVSDNQFYGCTTGILLDVGSNGHTIGRNAFKGTHTDRIVNNGGTNNNIQPFQFVRNSAVTFGGAATQQTITFPMPGPDTGDSFGVFKAAPSIGQITMHNQAGVLWLVGVYDKVTSTATSAQFLVKEINGASIPASTFEYSATMQSLV